MSHMKQTEILVVWLRGVNFECLVSLRVSWAKSQYFKVGVNMKLNEILRGLKTG